MPGLFFLLTLWSQLLGDTQGSNSAWWPSLAAKELVWLMEHGNPLCQLKKAGLAFFDSFTGLWEDKNLFLSQTWLGSLIDVQRAFTVLTFPMLKVQANSFINGSNTYERLGVLQNGQLQGQEGHRQEDACGVLLLRYTLWAEGRHRVHLSEEQSGSAFFVERNLQSPGAEWGREGSGKSLSWG